jgi:hypothetical protein
MIVYLYDGGRLEVATTMGIPNVRRCYNPLCSCFVQIRPANEEHAGRPKLYCTERCRYHWRGKRRTERRARLHSINTLFTKERRHGR